VFLETRILQVIVLRQPQYLKKRLNAVLQWKVVAPLLPLERNPLLLVAPLLLQTYLLLIVAILQTYLLLVVALLLRLQNHLPVVAILLVWPLCKFIVAHLRTLTPTPTPMVKPTVKPALSSYGSSTTTSIETVASKDGERLLSGSTSIVSLTVSVLLGLVFFLI